MKTLGEILSPIISLLGRRKAFVDINPRYDFFLKSQGLKAPEDFLSLPAIIVSGHPDRHVTRVVLGSGCDPIKAYLKKEHRVPWRDRIANALAGFGWCSKSYREAILLRVVEHSGIGGPEFLAAGEDGLGRAFLLVRELEGAMELRCFLEDRLRAPGQRRLFAKELGETLARIHNAGFDHRDLYSKHILVDTTRLSISILDWQRSRRLAHVTWGQRWRDLMAVDATVAEHLANPRERLACLRAYLSAALGQPASRIFFLRAARAIRCQSLGLLRRRKIREMRQPHGVETAQQLIWLKGEQLCATRHFAEATGGRMPEFLTALTTSKNFHERQETEPIVIPGVGAATLVLERTRRPFRWAWTWISRRRFFSSAQEKASIIFRLERHGVRTPRLLAFGQRAAAWRTESFLLTKSLDNTTPLARWLSDRFGAGRITETKHCWAMLREIGSMIRRMHEAHCYFRDSRIIPVAVEVVPGGGPYLVLGGLDGICKRHRPSRAFAVKDLRSLLRNLATVNLTRSDHLRFLLSYLGQERLTAAAKRLIRKVRLQVTRIGEPGVRCQKSQVREPAFTDPCLLTSDP